MRVLLSAHPTVGHTQALRAIGRELLGRGHEVRFAISALKPLPSFLPVPAPLRSAEALVKGLLSDGFALVPLAVPLWLGWAAWKIATSRGYDELDWALKLFTRDADGVAKAISAELRARPAEVVIGDCFHYGAWLAAESLGIPFVSVFHSGLPFAAPGAPPFGSALEDDTNAVQLAENQRRLDRLVQRVDTALAKARRALGLPEVAAGLLGRPYAHSLNVLTTFEQFELPRPHLTSTADGPLLWAGPCLGPSRPAVTFPWERLEGSKPLVYVSLGTVFNDQPAIYCTLLEGVHSAGARAVVAAGASLKAMEQAARPDDVVVKFAPQLELLPKMNVAVIHGGNNSTNETLCAGKPFLIVPFGGEQVANARRTVTLGVARAIAPATLEPLRVADALRWLLTPEAAQRSNALARSVPQGDGVARVVAAIESRWG